MAPIKFEENIKEKLESRRIQPSKNAWGNLESKLDTQGKKTNKKAFWVFGIAASLIGVFFIVQQFRVTKIIDETIVPIVVDNENTKVERSLVKTNSTLERKNNFQTPKKRNNNIADIKPISNKEKIKEKTLVINEVNSAITTSSLESNQTNKMVNSADSEIDMLLNNALSDLETHDDKRVTIDPNALLQNIEVEMEPSLRRQIFKAIEKNYQSVKTAVATRND